MQFVGKDIYIQRGETWSLDFDIVNAKGDPMMLLKGWQNPYIAITVTAARYEQEGDFRTTYWLDLSNRYVEKSDGSIVVEPMKTFISTEALFLNLFSVDEALSLYGKDNGGKAVLDKESDFDITNFLFVTDPNNDGNKVYKYVSSYTLDTNGRVIAEVWEEYNFRLIKQFNTREWTEQKYLYDMKLLTGITLRDYVDTQLQIEGNSSTSEDLQEDIDKIKDKTVREYVQRVFDEGMPLMPSYDTKALILEPHNIYVGADIQGGIIK